MRRLLLNMFCLLSTAEALASRALLPSDVGVLAPIPRAAEMSLALSPSDEGARGQLIPPAVLNAMPPLVPGHEVDASLRAIGFRIDPCFIEGAGPRRCQRQIRIVWQPIAAAATLDAAAHAFYEFDESAWRRFWSEYRALIDSAPEGVGGRMALEGLAGPTWRKFRELMLGVCGARALTRVTSMTNEAGGRIWTFRGFDVRAGLRLEPMRIPLRGGFGQVVMMRDAGHPEFHAAISPPYPHGDDGLRYLDDSGAASEPATRSFLFKQIEFENPDARNPGTLDCGSCHLANAIVNRMHAAHPFWDWATVLGAAAPRPPSLARSDQLRAFGYFGDQAVVSARAANEIAASLARLRGER